MKTLTFLAILILSTTAFADHRTYFSGGYRSGGYRSGYCAPRISYARPYYGHSYYGYRPSYYRSYPYCNTGFYFRPGITLAYSSGYPAYYGDYPRSYRNTRAYDDGAASIEVDVQRELKRRGYYRGAVDGDIGPGSRAAIRAWQDEHGLATTGRVDGALLRSLGI